MKREVLVIMEKGRVTSGILRTGPEEKAWRRVSKACVGVRSNSRVDPFELGG